MSDSLQVRPRPARPVTRSRLSLDRANAVEQILKEALPDSFFEIIPRGGIRPLAPNDTPFGRSRNRRVQVYLAAEEDQPDAAVVTPGG